MKYILNVSKKSGFVATGYTTIYHKSAVFYVTHAGTHFNLPKGIYVVESLQPLQSADIKRYEAKKPIRNRFDVKPKLLGITYTRNPNKASMQPSNKGYAVYVDKSFFDGLSETARRYLLYHEAGHNYFTHKDAIEKEFMCDRFAEWRLIEEGFNPSQIAAAAKELFTDTLRRTCCENNLPGRK